MKGGRYIRQLVENNGENSDAKMATRQADVRHWDQNQEIGGQCKKILHALPITSLGYL